MFNPDSWIADRNRCTLNFLGGIAQRQFAFVIREHQHLPWQTLSELQSVAVVEAGEWFESEIEIEYQSHPLKLRRIVLRLSKPTRYGDSEIVVLTNLPATVASAEVMSHLYRQRWQVEGLFLTVITNFDGEIETLAIPVKVLIRCQINLKAMNSKAIKEY